jgi:hypothetical protein
VKFSALPIGNGGRHQTRHCLFSVTSITPFVLLLWTSSHIPSSFFFFFFLHLPSPNYHLSPMDVIDLDALEAELSLSFGQPLHLDLPLLLLNTHPYPPHLHLNHILKFESSQLFCPFELNVDQNFENQESSSSSSHFLPFHLPESLSMF